MRDQPNEVLLTFDVEGLPPKEDIFDTTALLCLNMTLDILESTDFKGIFFITASAAEQIRKYPELVKRLSGHVIGYHSSSHSVKPRIIEYTDVPSYDEAFAISLQRETSHINPETGQIEGKGGILALRETFPKNDITCFRAPFLAWSPPHLEALKKLGIKFDFSSSISERPVSFRGVTFYPCPIPIDDGIEATFIHRGSRDFFPKPIESILLRRRVTVLSMHPPILRVQNLFDSKKEYEIGDDARNKLVASLLQLLLNRIRFLKKANLIEVSSPLNQKTQPTQLTRLQIEDVRRIYSESVQSQLRLFNINPQFVFSHFMHFFDQDNS